MTYPQFFDNIPKIKLQDDLASLLGAFQDGFIEYSFDTRLKDIVFKSSSLDDNFVSINDNVFLRVLDEDHVKYHMHNTINYCTKSAKSVRRSLMAYVIKSLNNSLIK